MSPILKKTVRELRDSLTNTELAYYMALFRMYPIGDEAMDARFAMILAKLDSGLGVVQLEKGKRSKVRDIFKRDFWTRPRSAAALKNKLMAAFGALGMEEKNG